MIKVQDWVATIPDGDKHVAYVGEGMSETREFLLCGEGWEAYRNWSFHLDMAFDPESITTRESRQVVQTHTNSSQMKEEAAVNTEESVTKESYTVENEEVLDYNLTDIASLEKHVAEDGIHLIWTVLRQHTVLPGRLWATLRAVDGTAQMVKKSAIMVFEVDAAICAVPAARPAISEMEQIEARVALAADTASDCADRAEAAMAQSLETVSACQTHAEEAKKAKEWALEHAMKAEDVYNYSTLQVSAAAEHKWAALEAAEQAQACVAQAQEAAALAENHCGQASNSANTAVEAGSAADKAAASAAVSAQGASLAVSKCAQYMEQCARYADGATGMAAYHRFNVRDYGAVGDGVTNDQPAIWAAWEDAKALILQGIPCELYVPAGTYGILQGGFGFRLPRGYGGLRITGAGRETTTIKYLANWQMVNVYGSAIDVFDIRTNDKNEAEAGVWGDTDTYIHDVSVSGFTFYDPDPIGHATTSEETHGVAICYCKRASVTECQFMGMGDESIDIYSCCDAIVMNNRFEGCPGAGRWGGNISIGDGSDGVVVMGNTINGSVDGKDNVGITVEGAYSTIQNVVIANNVIRNIHGAGMSFGAGHEGSRLYNILITDNVVQGCDSGVTGGSNYPKECVSIVNNHFLDCVSTISGYGFGIKLLGGHKNLMIRGNVIRNTSANGIYLNGEHAINGVSVGNTVLMESNTLENIGQEAMVFNCGEYTVRDCIVNGTGLVSCAYNSAIHSYKSTITELSVYRCRLTGIRHTHAISDPNEVEDTYIELVSAEGSRFEGRSAFGGSKLKRVVNCNIGGYVNVYKDNAVVQGNTIVADSTGNSNIAAVNVYGKYTLVSGCNLRAPWGAPSIREAVLGTTYNPNYNLFANNVVNRSITTIGTQSMTTNNLVTA